MDKLLCIEIPKGEIGGFILVRLRDIDSNKAQDILVQNMDFKEFQDRIEIFKYITFESSASVVSYELPTDEHGTIVRLANSDWIENIGYKTSLIDSYRYI